MLVAIFEWTDLLPNCMMYYFGWVEPWPGKGSCRFSARGCPDASETFGPAPRWRRSHVEGLKIHGKFDTDMFEMRVEPLLSPGAAGVAQAGQEIPIGVELARNAEL